MSKRGQGSATKVQVLTVETSWKVRELLERLVSTGLCGPTVESCAEELIRAELRRRFPPPSTPESA